MTRTEQAEIAVAEWLHQFCWCDGDDSGCEPATETRWRGKARDLLALARPAIAAETDENTPASDLTPAYTAAAGIAERWWTSTDYPTNHDWADASREITDAALDTARPLIAVETLRAQADQLDRAAVPGLGPLAAGIRWAASRLRLAAEEIEQETRNA